MLGDAQGTPETILLISILGIVFMKGYCGSEEVICEVLSDGDACWHGKLHLYGAHGIYHQRFGAKNSTQDTGTYSTLIFPLQVSVGPKDSCETSKKKCGALAQGQCK